MSIVPRPVTSLAAPPASSGWFCEHIELGETGLVARFRSEGSSDWIEVIVSPRGETGPVFRQLERCQVRYRGHIADRSLQRRAEVGAVVLGLATAIDERLCAKPGASIAEALGRPTGQASLVFGPRSLAELLEPEIGADAPVCGGWRLVDTYPWTYSSLRGQEGSRRDVVLDFRRDHDRRRTFIVVGPRRDDAPGFVCTSHFSISFVSMGEGGPSSTDVQTLRALVAFLLQLRDHPGLVVEFPDLTRSADVLALTSNTVDAIEVAAPDDVLNLAISSECAQSCSFCTIKETWPAVDGGEDTFARLCRDLLHNRRRGVRALRINGYDPLAYSKIFDVLAMARELDYERADVFSPCTLLADPAFCARVVRALPAERRFFVPLYGTTAATHDRVVGRDGAHALVSRALDNLAEHVPARDVLLLSVLTRDNLDEMPGLAAFAEKRGHSLSAHMPYPSFESRADRYHSIAPKQSDAVRALSDLLVASPRWARTLLDGVAPCVVFRELTGRGVKVQRWLHAPAQRPALPGTEYRDPKYRHRDDDVSFQAAALPCPHAGSCAIALACPGEVLRSYVAVHGQDELQPVPLAELLAATEPGGPR